MARTPQGRQTVVVAVQWQGKSDEQHEADKVFVQAAVNEYEALAEVAKLAVELLSSYKRFHKDWNYACQDAPVHTIHKALTNLAAIQKGGS